MIGAVLDTNVLVSALLRGGGPPTLVLRLALSESFHCFVSEAIFAEYETVLRRPDLKLPVEDVATSLRKLAKVLTTVTPRKRVHSASDFDDNKFLECALEARADYIVTGNLRHFPARFQDIRITSPRQFLTIFATQL